MRILNDNALNVSNTIFSSSNDNDNIENIFDSDVDYIGKFDSSSYGEITSTFTELTKINSISLFNTNAKKITFEFHKENGTIDKYTITEIELATVFNISETDFKKIIIKIYGHENATEKLYIGYLIIGLAIDFPPHSPAKTHKINFTREQFFSQAGKYFCRRIPFKSYDEWSVNFNFLTNENKDLMLNFFNENNNNSFVLQVWTQANRNRDKIARAVYGIAKYGISKYGVSENIQTGGLGNVEKTKYASAFEMKTGLYGIAKYGISKYGVSENIQTGGLGNVEKTKYVPAFEMKAGLYVITNETIEFKKTDDKKYQWSTSINFREVK